ncbi:hypothetical protein B5M42_017205 [Paenibacillus athensensis]|uniref:Uncharacterized protein n=1 Tax=Paenibacillus athensensis TaxID=1967502 RepID=A0A4Y8PSH1_9BACL|nr:hypothetical protein [Paenibacillus athensensis]MCD1260542.1 hypothetical protein [Paenibacillus athensensis]
MKKIISISITLIAVIVILWGGKGYVAGYHITVLFKKGATIEIAEDTVKMLKGNSKCSNAGKLDANNNKDIVVVCYIEKKGAYFQVVSLMNKVREDNLWVDQIGFDKDFRDKEREN